jgi:protein ImuA
MPTHLLTRAPERPKPALRPHPEVALTLARTHEACGPARRTFALWLAAQTNGPVMWISPAWEADQLHPDGMRAWTNPAQFLFVAPRRAEDILWSTEEALRSGAVPLVVADLPAAPTLTAVRRMHLAAEAGGMMAASAPLGLLLLPADGGAQGIETRWHMAPTHSRNMQSWRLERRRARALPPQSWSAMASETGLILKRIPNTAGD